MTAPEEALRVDPDDYTGPATVAGVPVQVNLHSWFEPIDGHVHWIGRIATNEALAEACSAGKPAQIVVGDASAERSEEHTSELTSLRRISYDVFCLIKKNT